jgi:RNA polymerase sigma factor (sigma-70 family)
MIDIEKRDHLVEKYYLFAVRHSNRYQNLVPDYADRRSFAGEALVNAVESWNSNGGASLKTHIRTCIKNRMIKHKRESKALKRDSPPMRYLDKELESDSGNFTLHDILASRAIDPQDYMVQKEQQSVLRSVLSQLPKIQYDIIDARYISNQMSQPELARLYKRTQSWVSRTERVGLEYCRKKIVKSSCFGA